MEPPSSPRHAFSNRLQLVWWSKGVVVTTYYRLFSTWEQSPAFEKQMPAFLYFQLGLEKGTGVLFLLFYLHSFSPPIVLLFLLTFLLPFRMVTGKGWGCHVRGTMSTLWMSPIPCVSQSTHRSLSLQNKLPPASPVMWFLHAALARNWW